jgi:hypothetical protein
MERAIHCSEELTVMPIHDWTRVEAGIFHHFHHEWISALARALNAGVLPPDYYALAEQIAGGVGPDVLALESAELRPDDPSQAVSSGGVALETAPPAVRFTATAESEIYSARRSRVAVHHSSDDRVVAMLEIVSPGNKSSRHALRSFVDKAVEMLQRGVHLLIIDLFPPTPRDPQGLHAAIWSELEDCDFELPAGEPLTLASYTAATVKQAFIEPTAVGKSLADMPLFLDPSRYVPTPLETTYNEAFAGVPARWQRELA